MEFSLRSLFDAVIASLNPEKSVGSYLRTHPIGAGPVTLLAVGKAAVPMATGARSVLGEQIHCEIVVAPRLAPHAPPGWLESDHPVPSDRSEHAARALLDAAANAQGPVLALISGGGSSLAALPAGELSLTAKRELVELVYAAGASIEELNTVRKHLSAIKGGRLAAATGCPVTSLVLSDVIGDSLSTIASGPTIPDPSTYDDALRVVRKRLGAKVSGRAVMHLERGAKGLLAETPKESRPGNRAVLLAGFQSLVDHASQLARASGAEVREMNGPLAGRVHEVCQEIVAQALQPDPCRPGLWIVGAEATIALPPKPGVGGRAQQLALLLAEQIAGRDDIEILVAGSDGIDGNSAAAGAVVDGTTWDALVALGIEPRHALAACDAGTALAAVGAQIVTGPTGVNHADIVLVQIS